MHDDEHIFLLHHQAQAIRWVWAEDRASAINGAQRRGVQVDGAIRTAWRRVPVPLRRGVFLEEATLDIERGIIRCTGCEWSLDAAGEPHPDPECEPLAPEPDVFDREALEDGQRRFAAQRSGTDPLDTLRARVDALEAEIRRLS